MIAILQRLWHTQTFRVFWLANTVSGLGTSAYVMAMSWLTVKLYGSHGIALLALGYGVPQLLLELFGGAATDRTPRRKLYVLTETSLLLVAAVLWLTSIRGVVPLWMLVGGECLQRGDLSLRHPGPHGPDRGNGAGR
jgi:MFS family permease